jgi:hypothetical protein
MGKKAELNYEFGSFWFWVAFGKEQPFVVTADRRRNTWHLESHPRRALTATQASELDDLLARLLEDIEHTWQDALQTHLHWPQPKKGKTHDDE